MAMIWAKILEALTSWFETFFASLFSGWFTTTVGWFQGCFGGLFG